MDKKISDKKKSFFDMVIWAVVGAIALLSLAVSIFFLIKYPISLFVSVPSGSRYGLPMIFCVIIAAAFVYSFFKSWKNTPATLSALWAWYDQRTKTWIFILVACVVAVSLLILSVVFPAFHLV